MTIEIVPQHFIVGLCLGILAGVLVPECVEWILRYKNKKNGYIIPVAVTCKNRLGRLGIIAATGALCGAAAGSLSRDIFSTVLVLLFVFIGVVLSIVDLEIRIIPNEALPFLLIISGLYCYRNQGFFSGLVAMVITFLMFMAVALYMRATKGVPGVGAGDVKLVAICACGVGLQGIMYLYPALAILLVGSCTLRFRMIAQGFLGKDFPMCGHIVMATYLAFLFLG